MEFTENEKAALEKLRFALGNTKLPYNHDCYLIKWLRARNMNVLKAEDMLRKHLKWREEYRIDESPITEENVKILERYYAITPIGNDKEGNLLFLHRISTLDLKGLLLSVGPLDLTRFDTSITEGHYKTGFEKTVKSGKEIRAFIIYDLEQVSFTDFFNRPVLDWLAHLSTVQSSNYPETLQKIVCINCSKATYAIYNAMTPFLAIETRQRFVLFGRDGWKEYLLRDIDASQLPEYYGGTISDGSEESKCLKLTGFGGKVPEELYMTHRLSKMVSKGEVKRCLVQRRSIEDAETVIVTRPGSILKFTVCIESMDICFRIIRCEEENSKIGETVVRNSEKLTSANVFSRFDLTCPNPGTYILRFDNSYSFWNAKEVFYKIEMVK